MGCCRKLGVLGSGSYGTVFLAQSLFSDNPVFAVKSSEIQNSYSLKVERDLLKAFQGSEFIVQCFGEDVSVENGKVVYNLLLEYAPRGTLENLIKNRYGGGGNIPESEVSRYAYQLLRGIYEVHCNGFVHCDIKPANILVFPCGCGCGANHMKIADFGLAKKRGGKYNIFGKLHQGTLLYTSPESVVSGVHEAPKDIWAIGCMVVEMMTGRRVWRVSCNRAELMWNIALKEPEIPDSISVDAKDFLRMCFEKDPNSRVGAEELLAHPFIANANSNSNSSCKCGAQKVKKKNPFGGWISEGNLFCTTTTLLVPVPRHAAPIAPPPGFHYQRRVAPIAPPPPPGFHYQLRCAPAAAPIAAPPGFYQRRRLISQQYCFV